MSRVGPEQERLRKVRPTQAGITRRRRRWLRGLGIVAAALLALVLAVYGWAWLSLDRSSIARAMLWRDADVGDQYRFPARPIPTDGDAGALPSAAEVSIDAVPVGAREGARFDDFLRDTGTRAFLIVHSDRVVYERYFEGSGRQSLHTSFSVAKSFVSTLVGIAIDEGLIESVKDPVTEYVPELAVRDPRFQDITIRDLLTMSSGLRYEEQELPLPWGDDVETYYGTDLRELALTKSEIEGSPGQGWLYNNYNPLLLGIALERATGTSIADYMASTLWRPLGAEHEATWSLDSERSGFEKMESGLNATAADYARFGLLFLHEGARNGTRIVSEDWVEAATSPQVTTSLATPYGYFWWIDPGRPERFYAQGNFGQYVYVAPDADTVIVRLGRDYGVDSPTWVQLFRDIADRTGKEAER